MYRTASTLLLGWLVPALAGATVPLACAPTGVSCERAPVGFAPAYPSGGSYDTFIGPVLGSDVPDDDADGAYNDERCGTDREASLKEIGAVLGILVAAGTACEAIPAGPDMVCLDPPMTPAMGPQEYCTAALAVPAAALEVDAIYITRCAMQGAFADRAEIEAAYENSKLILSRDLEQQLRECNPLVSLFLPRRLGGRLEEVQAFVALRLQAFDRMDAQSPADLSFDLGRAHGWFERGNDRLAAGAYKDAYAEYCRAYRELRNVSP